jgi:excisionase family DNA binding protein
VSRDADEQTPAATVAITPRLLDREQAGVYLGVSADTVSRLIHAGKISVVRLPVERGRGSGTGVTGTNRRVLIDRAELDALIPQWRERQT